MPEFIDPVFTKTSPKRSFSLNKKRAFWLVFAKTGSIISGTGIDSNEPLPPAYVAWWARARIFKLLRSPRIDSKEPIPPGCVDLRAGTTTLFLLGS